VYLWLNEGFTLRNKEILCKAFEGLKKNTKRFKMFKYTHVCNYIRRVITCWNQYIHKKNISRITSEILLKRKNSSKLSKTLKKLNSFSKRCIKEKLIKRKYEYGLLMNQFNMWKDKFTAMIIKKEKYESMESRGEIMYKYKVFEGFKELRKKRREKRRDYDRYMKVYNEKLLSRIIRKWWLLKRSHKIVRTIEIKVHCLFSAKDYFWIWRRLYLRKTGLRSLRSKVLKKLLLKAFKGHVQFINMRRQQIKLIMKNHIQFNKKKTLKALSQIVSNTKVKQRLNKIAHKSLRLILIRKALKSLKITAKKMKKQKIKYNNCLALINTHNKANVMKILKQHTIRNQQLKNNMQTFIYMKHYKVFKGFRVQVNLQIHIKGLFNTQIHKHYVKVKKQMMNRWWCALESLLMKLWTAKSHSQKNLQKKTIIGFSHRVSIRNYKLHSNAKAISHIKFKQLKKSIKTLKDYADAPKRVERRKAVYFYLNKIYRNYIRRLNIYSNKRKFINGIYKYYKLNTFKAYFYIWLVLHQQTSKRNKLSSLIINKKKKLVLLGLLMTNTEKKNKQRTIKKANQFNSNIIQRKAFAILRRMYEKNALMERRVQKVNMFKRWKEIFKTKKLLSMLIRVYKMNIHTNKMNDFLKVLYTKSHINHSMQVITKRSNSNLLKMTLVTFLKYVKSKKARKELNLRVEKYYRRNVMRKVCYVLNTKLRFKTLMKSLFTKGYEKNNKKLEKKALEGLRNNIKINRLYRSKAQIALSICKHYTLKYFLTSIRNLYSYRRIQRQLVLIQKRKVFRVLKEKILTEKINKKLEYTKLNTALNFNYNN